MAAPAKKPAGRGAAAKGGGKKGGNKPTKVYKYYKVSGEKVEKSARFCPKCGTGVFMAKHSNRYVCGNCHYTEFVKN